MKAFIIICHLLPLGAEDSKRGDTSEGDGAGSVGKVLVHRILSLVGSDSFGKCHLLGVLLHQGSVFGEKSFISDFPGCLLLQVSFLHIRPTGEPCIIRRVANKVVPEACEPLN